MKLIKNRNFILYTQGRLFSRFARQILIIALPLYTYDITKSAFMMSIMALSSVIPRLITLPFAGYLGDRINRKKIMIYTDLIQSMISIFIFILMILNLGGFWAIIFFNAMSSVIMTIFNTSTSAMLGDIVDSEDLIRASAVGATTGNIVSLVGPVLGALLYDIVGINYLFILNAVGYSLSAITECFIKYENYPKKIYKEFSLKSFKDDFVEVLPVIKNNQTIRSMIVLVMVINFMIVPTFSTVLPYGLRNQLNIQPRTYGLLGSFFILGSLCGNFFVGIMSKKINDVKFIYLGIFGMIISLFLYGLLFLLNTQGIPFDTITVTIIVHMFFSFLLCSFYVILQSTLSS